MTILVTGGCSCSVVMENWKFKTWPWHLEKNLATVENYHLGRPAQGNGLISRHLIYTLDRLLQTHSSEELLVGVMWSGTDRFDFYSEDPADDVLAQPPLLKPFRFVDKGYGQWVLVNSHWQNPTSKNYFTNFHDDAGAMITTYEHILRTQWFLKLHNIRYFMSTISGAVLNHDRWQDHPDISYLRNQVDFEKFLPVDGIWDWSQNYSRLEFDQTDLAHPTTEQNQKFVQEIVQPFLKQKNLI